MEILSRRALLLGGASCLLAACTQGQVGYSVLVNGEGNQVALVQEGPFDFVATVHSESGIGQANITWWGETSPHPLYFHLYLSGLEQFTLRWADVAVNVSVNSMDRTLFESYQIGRDAESAITADSPYWIEATNLAADNGFRLSAPAAFMAAAPRLWSIAWIDFYR